MQNYVFAINLTNAANHGFAINLANAANHGFVINLASAESWLCHNFANGKFIRLLLTWPMQNHGFAITMPMQNYVFVINLANAESWFCHNYANAELCVRH